MAGRKRISHPMDDIRAIREDPRGMVHRGLRPLPPHPVVLEEELEIQQREIHEIVGENRHLVDDNVFLQSELTAVKDEIHRLSQILPTVRSDKEAQTRDLVERGLKLEAELRSAKPLRGEVVQLRAESQKLDNLRQELSTQIQSLSMDVNRAKADNHQVAAMKADIEGMSKELMETRRVYEFEKKTNEELAEQNQAMEKNLISMACEIEKLSADLAVAADRRARGPGYGGYGGLDGSPETRYRGNSFSDPYANGPSPWGSYDGMAPPRR